jgi:monovalent cation:H+ antiporter-2, CPA2 family
MGNPDFLIDLGVALVAALLAGLAARAIRLPVVVGYLVAGLLVGPHTPGFVAGAETVRFIGDLGIVLLMFAVGVQFSLRDLGPVKRTALFGGTLQIALTIVLGIVVALLLGWDTYTGLFLGCALALSSTAIIIKILEERAELGSSHGSIQLGISVVQDLSLVVMIVLLPAIAGLGAGDIGQMPALLLALVESVAVVVATVIVAKYLVPSLLSQVVRTGSPELFLLTIVCLVLLAATGAEAVGLGYPLGAFIAGVIVSESPYSQEVFSQIRPLRDVFASIFFVSIGMLLNPEFLAEHWVPVTAVVVAILVGKAMISTLAVYLLGWHARTAFLAGIGLAQIGEFSFVLATEGARREIVDPMVADVILTSALITIFLYPFLYNLGSPFYGLVTRFELVRNLVNRRIARAGFTSAEPNLNPEVLVLGGGRVGRYVSDALRTYKIPHVVIDYDATAIARLRENDVPIIYGDASSADVVALANPQKAQLAIVALPEVAITEMAIKTLKKLAPHVPVVARVRRGIDIPRMRWAGADGVVHGEFESGVEMIRQALGRLGYGHEHIDDYIADVRDYRYREEE